ncbi:hypothetical protein CFOL_v3_14761, partial [Cephalotus follicularis]
LEDSKDCYGLAHGKSIQRRKVVIPAAFAVPSLRNAAVGDRFQFKRLGKFQNTSIIMIFWL